MTSAASGQMLSHYRLIEKIGEGGMGVVWKAVDTSLNRDVAIKGLPEGFAQDPERLARFEREARLLASLNHPNIATVHGLHEAPAEGAAGPVRFLAMELVAGEDLSERLARGPLSVHDALEVSVQVAAALEAAHAQGVVHRDLKPANVVLTPDGKAKVLDFGLAKANAPGASSASGSLSVSPTMTSTGTEAGMILGTAAYMSPEQARGKPVDRRSDLWAFGCLLYECLTGLQLFKGETVSDSLAAILRKDPDWTLLPDDTPPTVRLMLRRCLTRDPVKRLQDAGDARIELEEAIEDPRGESLGLAPAVEAAQPARGKSGWLQWAVTALAIILAIFFAMRGGTPAPDEAAARRLMIPVPGTTVFGDNGASPPVISPNGRQVVFGVTDENGEMRLMLRALDDFSARELPETDGAKYAFWSANSQDVGFFRGGKMRRVNVTSGRTQAIGGAGSTYPRGASWNAAGQIIFAPNSNTGIHLIDASGGEVRQITTPDPAIPDGSHRWPCFLPDGEHFLFVVWTNDVAAQEQYGGVYLASLSGADAPVKIVSEASSTAYSPPGYLLVVREDNLIAIPFDADQRRVTGEAAVIASGVQRDRGTAHSAFSVSSEGSLVFATGQAYLPAELTWYDRAGESTDGPLEPDTYLDLRLSPDARRAASSVPGTNGDGELWIIDLVRGVRTRLAHGSTSFIDPTWSADGRMLMYSSQEKGNLDIYVRPADGSGEMEPVLVDDQDKELWDWSSDGKQVAYWPIGAGMGTADIWVYSLETGKSEVVIAGEPVYARARFSHDARWISYASDDSGRMEVFVQALAGKDGRKGGARWQVSTAGGDRPLWRKDGREIVYVAPGQRVMAVSVDEREGELLLGKPRELFTAEEKIVEIDGTTDHDRFLLATRKELQSEPLRVVLDWTAGL
jgi:Tol biopolymer transport system component/tRNA A-37 threonylcarbamoyl transferase component Bud32